MLTVLVTGGAGFLGTALIRRIADVDEENDRFHGRVINISDVVNFEGKSMAELKKEFRKSMEICFQFCKDEGDKPEAPFSGRFILRVNPSVHRAITRAAEREGVSINKWAERQLELAAGG